jgi:hypothetical protein
MTGNAFIPGGAICAARNAVSSSAHNFEPEKGGAAFSTRLTHRVLFFA